MSDVKKGQQGHTISGAPARSEEEELERKRNKSTWGTQPSSGDDGSSVRESNARTDELSGGEGIDADPLPPK